MKPITLLQKLCFRLYDVTFGRRNFHKPRGFSSESVNKFLAETISTKEKSISLEHWDAITLQIRHQIERDGQNFLRNTWVRNALHPNQFYFSYQYYKYLRQFASKEVLSEECADIGLGNPLKDAFLKNASPASLKHRFLLKKMEVDLGVSLSTLAKVVEFGGGYGSTCRVAKVNLTLRDLDWNIIDLPVMLSLQRAYLRDSCGEDCLKTISFFNDFKSVTVPENSLFMATWSLSETPLSLRYEIEVWLKQFDYVFIAFQERYEHIDNLAHFKRYGQFFEDHTVSLEMCDIYPGHYYLKATRR